MHTEGRHDMRNTYRQNGCNRGGTEHALQLADKATDQARRSLAIELVDPEPGRAATLAQILAARGLPVTAYETPAPRPSPVTIDVYAVDDVDVLARALEGPIRSSLVEGVALVSVPSIDGSGGAVIGLAAGVTASAPAVREDAGVILDRIAALSPGRQSSERMSAHAVHADQMPRARHAAHDWLTTQSASFLTTGHAAPGLVAADGFSGTAYRLEVVEDRWETRRGVLKQTALQEILPQARDAGESQGVVFYERQDPWLYLVLARRRADRWRLDRALELPVTMPQPLQTPAPVRIPTFVTD
jgi:hypothetical protein